MSDTKTLDALLRARAEQALMNEIHSAFRVVRELAYGDVEISGSAIRSTGTRDGDKVATVVGGYLFDQLEEYAFERLKNRRGDEAVKAFVERVESVGDEINELRDEVLG